MLGLGLAALQGVDFVQPASPHLHELHEASRQTVNYCVLRGDRVLYLLHLRDHDLMGARLQAGSTLPAVYAAPGKVLLAYLSRKSLDERIGPTSFDGANGPNAPTSLAALRRQLVTVRKRGWALQDGEFYPGSLSIAGPVTDAAEQTVASVGLSFRAPAKASKELVNKHLEMLLDTCRAISGRLAQMNHIGHDLDYSSIGQLI